MDSFNLEEAVKKTNKLQKTLQDVELLIEDLLIYPEQKERFKDFCLDVMAIADGENSYRQNMNVRIAELRSAGRMRL